MGSIIKGVLIVALLIIGSLLIVNLYLNINIEPEVFFAGGYYFENITQEGKLQFYPDMRFDDSIVTYKIDYSCDSEKSTRIKQAFSEITEKTIISFKEVPEDEHIFISCNESHNQQPDGRGMFIAGEGGPLDIIRTGLFHLILKSKVLLFTSAECEKPNVEIHEIMHALGFEHSNNKRSIMYPVVECKQELTEDATNEVNRLYSFSALPDLKFEKVTAIKRGRYLDFNASVKNQGLKPAENVTIEIYSENERADLFDYGDIIVGGTKILTVQNSILPSRKIKSLSFFIDYKNKIRELNETNNRLYLYIQE